LWKVLVAFRSAKEAVNPRNFCGAKGDNPANRQFPQQEQLICFPVSYLQVFQEVRGGDRKERPAAERGRCGIESSPIPEV
jgi:hypothetical protein